MAERNLIKVKFLRNGTPTGRPYTYESPVDCKVGDTVKISEGSYGIVTDVGVPESEIKGFEDRLKSIQGITEYAMSQVDLGAEPRCDRR